MAEEENLGEILEGLKNIPKRWDGKEAILDMKDNGGKNWKQMEWIGWYFEFLCERYLMDIMKFHKIRYGNTSIDGFLNVPFDFKTHILNSKVKEVVINDKEAILKALKEYGHVFIIMALGQAKYNDLDRKFYKWHEEIKGGKSKYELERIKRKAPSRLRKIEFDLKEIILVRMDKETLKKCKMFQENFRNSNGSPRNLKLSLNPNRLNDEEIISKIAF